MEKYTFSVIYFFTKVCQVASKTKHVFKWIILIEYISINNILQAERHSET